MDNTRIAADENAVKDVMETIESITCMEEKGEDAAVKFVTSNILSSTPDIHVTIEKTNLKTFSTMGAKAVTTKNKKGEIVALKNSKVLFAKMLLIAKTRSLEMKEVLQYSLRPYPSPLGTSDEDLVKTQKSKQPNRSRGPRTMCEGSW